MAIKCCHKEFAEVCEICVCVDAPASFNPGLNQRLRFGLLSSSWLPRPLGNFLWSALHVMLLIVGGPILWLFGLLIAFFLESVLIFGLVGISLGIVYVLLALYAVAGDLARLLVQSTRSFWSFVGFLACHEPIVEYRGGACLTIEFWKEFKVEIRKIFWAAVPIGVPCMNGSLYEESKDQQLEAWARWCEEVVHIMHDAIAL